MVEQPEISGRITFKKVVQVRDYESETLEISQSLCDGDCAESMADMLREMVCRHLNRENEFKPHAKPNSFEEKAEEKPAPAKRKRRTKAEMETDKAAEEAKQLEAMQEGEPEKNEDPTVAASPIVEETVAEIEGNETPSLEELAKYATAAAAAVSGKDVNALLKDRFGVSMLGRIEEGDRKEAIALLKAMTP